ncbi:hypothetical protein Pcinc_030440 [Petrolisthes cinctipes]|uniref:Fucosyltransferase n=1 Tax=Petrolisthes cinctipes TaxID=88211 RepID=A0AAE1EYP7_PETCI|nr:hypothetical protein Pcinc_030440 [Petrolisthes cinctipes]
MGTYLLLLLAIGATLVSANEDEGQPTTTTTPNDVIYEPLNDSPYQNVILWWTKFTQTPGINRECGEGSCYFTELRDAYLTHPRTKAVLFYGSDFSVEDLPLPRKAGQWWGLLHEESPKNNPLFDHRQVVELFNLTGTFRRTSDFPLTLLNLKSLEALTSAAEFVPTWKKDYWQTEDNLAPVVYVSSNCDTPSERDDYVRELSRYIRVDSYGECLHNRDLPEHLRDSAATHNHPEFRSLMARYKFTIAIENAACDDYITEKLWRPLTLGSVPVYWGSPSVHDWEPNLNSVILISDFDSPRELAKHLHTILNDDQLYESHLKHKIDMQVTNSWLVYSLRRRSWGVDDLRMPSFVDEFECYVCDRILSDQKNMKKNAGNDEKSVKNDVNEVKYIRNGNNDEKIFNNAGNEEKNMKNAGIDEKTVNDPRNNEKNMKNAGNDEKKLNDPGNNEKENMKNAGNDEKNVNDPRNNEKNMKNAVNEEKNMKNDEKSLNDPGNNEKNMKNTVNEEKYTPVNNAANELNSGRHQATLDHYGCPEPIQVLHGRRPNTHSSFWVQQWHKAGIEARVLGELARANVNYTAPEFYERVISKMYEEDYFARFPPHREEL